MARDDVPVRADFTTIVNAPGGPREPDNFNIRRSAKPKPGDIPPARRKPIPPKEEQPTAVKLLQPASNKPLVRVSSLPALLKPGQGGDIGLRDSPSAYELHRWASISSLNLAGMTAPLTVPPRSKWPLGQPPRFANSTLSQRSITPSYPLGSRADLVIKPSIAQPKWRPDERITRHLCTAGGPRPPPADAYASSLERFPFAMWPQNDVIATRGSTYRALTQGHEWQTRSGREWHKAIEKPPPLRTFRGWNDVVT